MSEASKPSVHTIEGMDELLFVKVIGQGKFGLVLLACHKDDQSLLFAVKVLSKAHLIKEGREESAFTEKRIHKYLSEVDNPFKG